MSPGAQITESFAVRKRKIEETLSLPCDQYADLSPKGSVDDGIRELIHLLNSMEGIVTTSSCAGRTTVFVEGKKNGKSHPDKSQTAVPGGKGLGGYWAFVSHDRLNFPSDHDFFAEFGLSEGEYHDDDLMDEDTQLIKMQFEPILHILAASLRHAKSILAAAVDAGMRESGIQSLKSLDNPSACPMVAVRSSGLAHSSVIGYVDKAKGELTSLVDQRYLRLMVVTCQRRFEVNTQRIERLKKNLLAESQKPLYQRASALQSDDQ